MFKECNKPCYTLHKNYHNKHIEDLHFTEIYIVNTFLHKSKNRRGLNPKKSLRTSPLAATRYAVLRHPVEAEFNT